MVDKNLFSISILIIIMRVHRGKNAKKLRGCETLHLNQDYIK